MATASAIEWTDATWNPTTGCDRVSPGCDNCYALTMAKRLKAMGQAKYQRDGDPRTSGPGFGLTMHPDVLEEPLRWRKPRRVFVNSMSDLFHPRVDYGFIVQVFAVMAVTPLHQYQILTKRPKRMRSVIGDVAGATSFEQRVEVEWERLILDHPHVDHDFEWPLPNVWLGTSVEDQQRADQRIPPLLDTPAAVRFLSCEPLLGSVDLRRWTMCQRDPVCHPNEPQLDWVIVGGESGPGARPMNPVWARTLVDQCRAADVAVFVKQFGAWVPVRDEPRAGDLAAHADGRIGDVADIEHGVDAYWTLRRSGSHHGDPDEWPPRFRVREFPQVAA